MSDENLPPEPTPQIDPTPPEGPGGVDAVPDWEAAGPDPVTPDQPRSAQVRGEDVPDEIDRPERSDEDESEPDSGADDDAANEPEKDSPA